MQISPSSIVTLVRLRQPPNASTPMEVTLEGRVIPSKKRQLSNALSPIAVTGKPPRAVGMTTEPPTPLDLTPMIVTDLPPVLMEKLYIAKTPLHLRRQEPCAYTY